MSDDKLKGIKVEKGPDNVEPDEVDVDDLLTDLTVKDLSKFSPEQLNAIFSAIDGDVELEGISIEEEEQRKTQRRETALQAAEEVRQRDITVEAELTQLEEITSNTEILKRVAANTATISKLIEDSNALLEDIITALGREPALVVKDSDVVDFNMANNAIDVVKEDEISTSVIVVKADPSNSGNLFLGQEGVQAGNGFKIEAGETRRLQIDSLLQPFQIVAEESDDTYTYLALGEDI